MTHRNEFPAEYSLAGCSPAEPTSASSALVILNQKPTRSPVFFSERQLFPNPAVSFHRAVHLFPVFPVLFPVCSQFMCLRINDVPSVPSLGRARARARMGAQIFYIDFKFTGNSGNSGNKAIQSAVYGVPGLCRLLGTLGTAEGMIRRIGRGFTICPKSMSRSAGS